MQSVGWLAVGQDVPCGDALAYGQLAIAPWLCRFHYLSDTNVLIQSVNDVLIQKYQQCVETWQIRTTPKRRSTFRGSLFLVSY